MIDLYCGSGAVILGHADPGQTEAVRAVLSSGATVSLRHPVELELADHLVDLCPGARYAAFFKTGSEAVHAAIITALKASGRRSIVTTTYHGWLLPLGDLRAIGGCAIEQVDWSSPTLVADVAAYASSAACIVISPTPDTPGIEVVRAVAEAARAAGAAVIFDEVKSGFRFAYPTVSAQLGIEPDLTVVSKAIGNGFPIAALLGGDLLATDETFSVYSTYASEIVSETAALACLRALADGAYETFAENSSMLYEALRKVGAGYGVGVTGAPTFFRMDLPAEFNADDLCQGLYTRGVLYHPLDQVLVSAAHGPEVIERVCASFEATLGEMAKWSSSGVSSASLR
jgi:glutamate-1-semialdehyde aminotransferase